MAGDHHEPGHQRIIIHTDGSCKNNPGRGGWAAILSLYAGESDVPLKQKAICGSERHSTTSSRMELTAAIKALKRVRPTKDRPVTIISDSNYLVQGMTDWLPSWKARGWKTSSGASVRNEDLWQELDLLSSLHVVTWEWVRGHNGNALNEKVDRLAKKKSGVTR